MNFPKLYSINFGIFVLSLAILLFIIVSSFFTPFTILTGGACSPLKICDTVEAKYVLWPLISVSFISGAIVLIGKIKNKTGKKIVIVISGTILMLISIFFLSLGSARCSSRNSVRKADLRQMTSTQELFYSEFGRYAEGYEELSYYFGSSGPPVDPRTEERYTDADGEGLEGGDSDSNTWLVRAWIEAQQYNYCIKTATGYWYVCDQGGCHDNK